MRVAIVYDRVNKWGGAERVLLALHEIYPKAPLYTSVYDKRNASWAKVFPEVKTSFLQKIKLARSNHEYFAPLMPLAFRLFDFSNYDVVISVTSEAAKFIKTKGKTIHICYCLTPTRYLWSHEKQYFENVIIRWIAKPVTGILRFFDKLCAQKPNKIISISKEVQSRVKKYYGRNSNVIFPPVDMLKVPKRNTKKEYYLVVSRLDYGYKKVDLVIKSFNKLGFPLVIVGKGREESNLKNIAKRNIKFVGKVDDKKLAKYYQHAKALIMPQEEDFGIVALEAQSVGCPVISFEKGGALDTVIPGKTGIFFADQKEESLIQAVKDFEIVIKSTLKTSDLVRNAKRFSKSRFKREFATFVKSVRMS